MHRRTIPTILLLTILLPALAVAEWSHDPMENNLVIEGVGSQRYPKSIGDGAGGFIVCWVDQSGENDELKAQRIDADGNLLWPAAGVDVCSYGSTQRHARVVTDGAGGAIIVWNDFVDSSDYNIFAQRLGPDGALLWAPSGQRVCAASGSQFTPVAVSDDEGGVYVVWSDYRTGADIYLQHLDDAGTESWLLNGLPVCVDAAVQNSAILTRDGDEGVIVAWVDSREAENSIYAQRVDRDGVMRWTADGVQTETSTSRLSDPAIVGDGSGGAFIACTYSYGSSSEDIMVIRIDDAGLSSWPWGRIICDHDQRAIYPELVSDGAYGAYVVWRDDRSGSTALYGQRVDHSGHVRWTANGVRLTEHPGEISDQLYFDLALDAQGGLLAVIGDGRLDNFNMDSVYAQRLAPDGSRLWAEEGVLVRVLAGHAPYPNVTPTDDGGALVALTGWTDAQYSDVYAQRIDPQGALGDNAPRITAVTDVPGDQGGQVRVDWTAAWPDRWPERAITEYSLWVGPAGPAKDRPALAAAPPERFVSFAKADWYFVQTVPALQSEEYGCPSWTFGDSTAAGVVPSLFRVIAHTDDPLVHWTSATEVGHSVDDLAPSAPLLLTAVEIGPSQAQLTWSAGGADADLSHYVIYRGDASGFPADAAHAVGTSAVPIHADDTGGVERWYRVRSVDVHDNASEVSNEAAYTPLTGVDDGPPTVFALRGAVPNPFNPSTHLHFDLPADAAVRLEVYDAAGRLVKVLAEGVWPQGRHAVAWDGRDAAGRERASGLYFARLRSGDRMAVGRLMLIR